ncbi:hypothetical protein F889_00480 [Acinetobacter colistiniresistens]|uniref:Uncharacterized protein n=2 Tax=Acinetobacter colistiniresistens TaxID=280145 RepID=N9PS85_9GAMM|nr:hypothetical protein F889_00480 [Acinetobacter colistiniresistens]
MNLILEYIKKASFIEILTVLFFLSVGVSLAFKIGFYNALGVGWYIQNLTPQLLFISSLKIIFISFGGVGAGYIIGLKFSEKFVSTLAMAVVTCYSVFVGLIEPNFDIKIQFSDYFGLILFLYYTTTSMYVVSLELKNRRYNNTLFVGPRRPITREEFFLDNVFKCILVLSFFFLPFATGSDAGKLVKKNKYENNEVVVKGSPKKWYLVDISGDKVLLKEKNIQDDVFKMVEYKEIETITVK